MSDEQFFCEYCGYYSDSNERCTHCGKDIADLFTNPSGFRIPLMGKLLIRPYDRADAERTWTALAEVWGKLERETNLGLLPSQMKKFPPPGDVIELYGSDFEASILRDELPGRLVIEFQELPREQIPHRPKYQLPRPPTVPRNKR
ncbi:hypothetical protein [Vitiosangium sp. GDMCC 1.1324]|uniref:hypothetical protein n=1 Tax=Vitiosangium sp. (strain GDMCC 1.1324) TaxID=2138576 RepID=UPI000D363D51|nr:hypothetical protein [Vitiosangium sp. GDMCC 1.1324]PTL84946.1 hypothetical protein DAT35_07815 [Vitiosangium sp. GDMCC 1.1324]